MLYITFYIVIGSRNNGSYLVNANSKKEANAIVKKLDVDYTRIRSLTAQEFGQDWQDIVDGIGEPVYGAASFIESGT